MGKSAEQYGKFFDSQPEATAEGRMLALFASVGPAMIAELRAFGETGADQLSQLFVGAQIGVVELLSNVQEKTAAWLLRSLFGVPNLDLEGAVPVALELQQNELIAAGDVLNSKDSLTLLLENFAQMIGPMIEEVALKIEMVAERIEAKKKALTAAANLELSDVVAKERGAFTAFTDRRLLLLEAEKRQLHVRLKMLTELLGRFAVPLSGVVNRLSSGFVSVTKIDPAKAIPVGEVAQPA